MMLAKKYSYGIIKAGFEGVNLLRRFKPSAYDNPLLRGLCGVIP
jgi:hypothetical protein